MGRWVNTQAFWANSKGASSLPAFSLNVKMVCITAVSSCCLQRTSVIGPPVFCIPCLHWIQRISLQSPYVSDHGLVTETLEVCEMGWLHWRQLWMTPKRVMGPLELFSVLQKAQPRLPTVWCHRLKHICFGPELCQLHVQWPWWQHRGQKPFLAARSVSY